MTPRLLLIDNYDSFTFNLVQGFRILGAEVLVYRNDEIDLATASGLEASHVVISPGPGKPGDAGVSMDMIGHFAGRLPVMGVCLGHQSIVAAFGGTIVSAGELMHGKTSLVHHDGAGLLEGLPEPFEAGRYHSLAARREDLPADLVVTARTDDEEIMGVRHREMTVEGVQFHPESVLTPSGQSILGNFLRMRRGSVDSEVDHALPA